MDIVEVEWIDAATTTHELSLDQAREQTCMPARSVGYLISNNKERVVLAMTEFTEAGDVKFLHNIPKGMIKKIKKLGKV